MTKTKITLLLAVCMSALLALAQNGAQGHHRPMPSVEDQLNRLSANLNLSDSQKTQVQTILQDEQDKMNALRRIMVTSREDRHAKRMEIHQAASDQIRGLLTEDQKPKYDAMEDERQQEIQSHGRSGMGGNH